MELRDNAFYGFIIITSPLTKIAREKNCAYESPWSLKDRFLRGEFMKFLGLSLLLLVCGMSAAQAEYRENPAQFYTVDRFAIQPFETLVFDQQESWINQYPLVIVINKSNIGSSKQSLRMYEYGNLTFTTAVSTGREQWEQQKKWVFGHGPKKGYFSSTNQGYFRAEYLSADHKSKLWGTKMPWAVFFNEGIAIHQAPKGTEGALGKRASGGCVRISNKVAQWVFQKVKATGTGLLPKFNRAGDLILDKNGQVQMEKGWKTLIIVEDVID
jgi:lipoprotein-anchoring transpeptidase ErfK/SrfK